MSIYNETMYILKKNNIVASKKLGQNFLIDNDVVLGIISCAEINNNDLVIEIGPGLGTLTKELLVNAKKVIAIELDTKMIKVLEERFSLFNNFELIHEDVLKMDLKKLIEKEKKENNIKNVKIVANLPYYITTPIIMKLLEERLDIDTITVMIQKEVAERVVEIPGGKKSGAITYSVNYFAEAKPNFTVSNKCFVPEPAVESQVITLKVRKTLLYNNIDEKKLFKLIKISFMQRRKTLVNALSNGNFVEKNQIIDILKKLNIDEKVRGESLSLKDFVEITALIE